MNSVLVRLRSFVGCWEVGVAANYSGQRCRSSVLHCWLLQTVMMGADDWTTPAVVDSRSSSAHAATVGYVTDGILTNVIVVAGLLANALTLAVLSRGRPVPWPSCLTLTLAVLSRGRPVPH